MTGRSTYADALGLETEPGDGAPVLRMPFAETLVGRPGFLHGGAIAGLLEIAAVAALRHALGPGDDARLTTATVTVDYLRSGQPTETRATAHIVRLGRRVANVSAEAWQEDRARPIAAARVNILIARAGGS